MASSFPTQFPVSVFIDTMFLIDLIDNTRERHHLAKDMMALFDRHQSAGNIFTYTSLWNLLEGHGILYANSIISSGTPRQRSMQPNKCRNIIPPESQHLSNAQKSIEAVLTYLKGKTLFQPLSEVEPGFFELVNKLSTEHAIWPADSVHLAFALNEGCSLIISDDGDLCDKIECASSFIQSYQTTAFSQVPLPPFRAAGLKTLKSQLPKYSSTKRETAFDVLRNLGLT